MKGRLSSTIWTLVIVNLVALFGVLSLAYSAGKDSGGLPLASAFSAPGSTPMLLLIAGVVAVAVSIVLFVILGNRVIKPVREIAEVSEKLANGGSEVKAESDSHDDFGSTPDKSQL